VTKSGDKITCVTLVLGYSKQRLQETMITTTDKADAHVVLNAVSLNDCLDSTNCKLHIHICTSYWLQITPQTSRTRSITRFCWT